MLYAGISFWHHFIWDNWTNIAISAPCYIAKALLHGRDSNMLRRACYGRATTYCKLGLGVAIGSRDNVCVARLAMLLPCCYMRALFGNVAKAKIAMVLLFGTARQSSLASAQLMSCNHLWITSTVAEGSLTTSPCSLARLSADHLLKKFTHTWHALQKNRHNRKYFKIIASPSVEKAEKQLKIWSTSGGKACRLNTYTGQA